MQLTIQSRQFQQPVHFPEELGNWSEDEFFQFCQANENLRIERTAKGEIIVMPPAGGYSGYESCEVSTQLNVWAKKDRTGVAFDSSTGFILSSGAVRSPDAAWVLLARLRKLSRKDREQFIPLCPDFLIEVASASDRPSRLREKMEEYRQSGLELGWLILPRTRHVEVYTAADVQRLRSPQSLSASLLPGFSLDLTSIWNPPF